MSVPAIAFFNNRNEASKSILVYHLAWMLNDLGLRVVAADLDPQANLTTTFLDEDRLEVVWTDGPAITTIFDAVSPLLSGSGDITTPILEPIDDRLALLVGDVALSSLEEDLAVAWPRCLDRHEHALRVSSAFWRITQGAAVQHEAEIILIDVGPNLGAMSRAALLAADYVVVPLSPDLPFMRGLRGLGPALRAWRAEWAARLADNPVADLALPQGRPHPLGYVVVQLPVRLDRPMTTRSRLIADLPRAYHQAVLAETGEVSFSIRDDPACLAIMPHYAGLLPLAQEARKPMFHLKPADGIMSADYHAARGVYRDYKHLADVIRQSIMSVSYAD